MKSVKRFARMIALAAVVCMMLTMGVLAAEDSEVWLDVSSAENNTVAALMTDGTITNGVVAVTGNADDLSYQDIELNEDYVAMYSVNADEDGVVLISWVAPGEVEVDGEDWLMKVSFTGTTEAPLVLSGKITGGVIVDGEGSEAGPEPTEPETTVPGATNPTEDNKGQTGGNGGTDTGDDSNILLPVILAVVCVGGIAALSVVMLKQKKGGKA